MKIEELIGIPYKHCGRDLTGLDCYGLVKFCYDKFLGIILPEYTEYTEEWYKTKDGVLEKKLNEFSKLWTKIEVPEKWDIITFNHGTKNIMNHCALYIGDDKVIHTYKDTPVGICRLTHPYWNSKVKNIMRYVPCL